MCKQDEWTMKSFMVSSFESMESVGTKFLMNEILVCFYVCFFVADASVLATRGHALEG